MKRGCRYPLQAISSEIAGTKYQTEESIGSPKKVFSDGVSILPKSWMVQRILAWVKDAKGATLAITGGIRSAIARYLARGKRSMAGIVFLALLPAARRTKTNRKIASRSSWSRQIQAGCGHMKWGKIQFSRPTKAISGSDARKTMATIIQTKNMVRRCSPSDEEPSDIDSARRWIGSVARPQL